MTTPRGGVFRAFRNHNYRLYFVGQLVSLAGTFMQRTAQAWLVLRLTNSGTSLGLVVALQYLPILLLGGYGGVLADRFDRRRLYIATEIAAAVEAIAFGVLISTGSLHLWMIYVLAVTLGLITCIEEPVKQAMVYDLVGPDDLQNAVSLGMSLQNAGRVVGPALAGVVISAFGLSVCFFANGVSFVVVVAAMVAIRRAELQPQVRPERQRGMFLDGVRQVRRDPRLTALLLTSGLLFGLAWEFEIVVPLMARYAFHGGAGILGMLTSGQAVGAVVGGLWAARRSGRAPTTPGRPAMAFGVAMLAAAVAPTLAFELVALLACGVTGIALVVSISTRIQLMAPPAIRGRVLALFTVCTVGVRPVCAPLVGWVGQHFGPRWALGLGAGVVLLVIVPSWRYISKTIRRSELDAAVVVPVPEATMTSL